MARRVSDTFKAGMITDVLGAEGSVYELSDMYVRRAGELCTRGPLLSMSATATNAGFHAGWSQAQFHPNLGVAACRATVSASGVTRHVSYASRFQLMGAPLQTVPSVSATPLTLSFITEGTDFDQVPLHAGVATAASAATGLPMERVVQMTNAGDEVLMAGEIGSLYKWGGCLVGAYKTGSVAIATASGVASRIITGTGTSWATAIQEGQYILIDGVCEKANGFQRSYRITKVIDNTHLEIELPIWDGVNNTGLTYRIQSVAVIQSPDGVWNQTDERPRQVGVVAYHQGRCWTAGVADRDTAYNTVYNYDRIRWSGTLDENSNGYSHLDLWGASASIDIFPGIGGSIRGLVSMGNELVVVKSHGLFRVTGSAAWDGSGSGLGVQIISTEVGANGFGAWTLTSRGLVIAARDGLYLYDGESVRSLTDGRIKRWWEANYPGKEYVVSQYEDKVIVAPAFWAANAGNKLVWDAEQDLFWTMTSNTYEFSAGVSTYTSSDEFVADYCFEAGGELNSSSTRWHYIDGSHLNHKLGFDTYLGVADGYVGALGVTGLPKPAVMTQPYPLGEDPLSEGRVNNVIVHAATPINVNGSSNADQCTVYVLSGASHTGVTDQFNSNEFCGKEYQLEYGVAASSTEDLDRVHRIPVDGTEPAPYARILLDSNSGFVHSGSGLGMRIYAIGFDFEPDNVQGPS